MILVIVEVVGEVMDVFEIVMDQWVEGGCLPLYWAVVGFPTTWLEIHPFGLQKSTKYALIPNKYQVSILEPQSISRQYG